MFENFAAHCFFFLNAPRNVLKYERFHRSQKYFIAISKRFVRCIIESRNKEINDSKWSTQREYINTLWENYCMNFRTRLWLNWGLTFGRRPKHWHSMLSEDVAGTAFDTRPYKDGLLKPIPLGFEASCPAGQGLIRKEIATRQLMSKRTWPSISWG